VFTGIIEEVGAVSQRGGAELHIVTQTMLPELELGDSVAVNGACLTVEERSETAFVVKVSPETFDKTTLGSLQPGHAVNLERAVRVGDRLDGHIVQGHVDGVGMIESVTEQGEFSLWRFRAPDAVARYLVPKGSVAIDGISLTVVDPAGDRFAVAIIPTTRQRTTLSSKRAGDPVNMEADIFGKHIYHYINRSQSGLTQQYLAQHGFA